MTEPDLKAVQAALSAWQHGVEDLTNATAERWEREKAAPKDDGRTAYSNMLHDLAELLRNVARKHNAAVAALTRAAP